METQVQLDERHDLLDELRGVTQRLQPLTCHLRTLDLVMVEGDALGSDLLRRRLSDVVQEGSHPKLGVGLLLTGLDRDDLVDNCERVPVHVLVPVHGVLFELQIGKLRQEQIEQSRLGREVQPFRRVVGVQGLRQLVADALGGHDLQPLAHLRHRAHHGRIGLDVEQRDEPGRAQHA